MQLRTQHNESRRVWRNPEIAATGFTLVELTLIIFLAGVVVALALPRFLASEIDRHEASVQGVVAGLTTALELFRGQHQMHQSYPAKHRLAAEFPQLLAQANGYPYAQGDQQAHENAITYAVGQSNTVVDAGDCVAVWDGLLQSAAPQVQAVAHLDGLLGSATTYTAVLDNVTCQYFHTAAGNEPGDRVAVIRYNTVSGFVSQGVYMLRPAES